MMSVLLWIIAALVLLIVVLGATPVFCEFKLSRDPELRFRVRLKLLNGWVPDISLVDSARPRKPAVKKEREPKKRKPRSRRKGPIPVAAISDLVGQLLAAIHFDRLTVAGRFGTGDPAETGEIYGYLSPVIHGLAPVCPRMAVSLTPVFDAPCLEGHVSGQLRVVPFALAQPIAWFGIRLLAR